jgi:hypothetical protein
MADKEKREKKQTAREAMMRTGRPRKEERERERDKGGHAVV